MHSATFNRLLEAAQTNRGIQHRNFPGAKKAIPKQRPGPCVFLEESNPIDLSCGCKAYGCLHERHDIAVPRGRAGRAASHCNECRDYVQKVPAKTGPMIDVVIGITRAPIMRKGKAVGQTGCIEKTLASLETAGYPRESITIFAEPESEVPPNVRTVWREKKTGGPLWNMYAGICQLAEESPGIAQLWLEHDSWVAPHVRDELRDLPGGDKLGMLQVFRMSGRLINQRTWKSADSLCENKRSDGYQKIRQGQFLWGSNVVLFPWHSVAWLVENPPPKIGFSCSPDVRFSKMFRDAGFELWCCNPSLGQTDTTLPSSTGHNVSPRMAADTYQGE